MAERDGSWWARTLARGALYFAGYEAAGYVWDIFVREWCARRAAVRAAARSGKPVLDVGTGTPETSWRCRLFGTPLYADVHLDTGAPDGMPGPDRVVWGDIQDLSEWPDKYFSAASAFHVLEHVEDPVRALEELCRVADEVFIVVPSWWCPHTWLHTDHRWFIRYNKSAGGFTFLRLRGGNGPRRRFASRERLREALTCRA